MQSPTSKPANNLQAFGSKAVLTIEPQEISPQDPRAAKELKHRDKPFFTVNIEMAPIVKGKSQHDRKVIFQPTISELPLLTACFVGLIPFFRLSRGDKWISFERQKNNSCLYIKAAQSNIIPIPLKAGDLFLFSDVLLSRLILTSQSPPDLVIQNLKSASAIYLTHSQKELVN